MLHTNSIMKNTFLLAAFIFLNLSFAFSQAVRKEVINPDYAGKIFRNPAATKNKIQGSPYVQKMFASANVENLNIKAYMRYNVLNDEFEFITPKNDTLILDKIEDFSSIYFSGLNKRYKLTQYTNDKKLAYGYLIEVYKKGDFGLFRKENISFIEGKVAKTSLETSMPAKYTKSEDSYFLKNKETISEFPGNKKQLIKLFPEKKAAIESFFKDNKISFDEDSDRIKIIDFIATL